MAKHTITISDLDEGGISIIMANEGKLDSMAGITAVNMMMLAKTAAKRAAEKARCQCRSCQKTRSGTSIPSGTTIH